MNGLFRHSSLQAVRKAVYMVTMDDSDGCADMKFVLLHEGKNDDGIRQFFMDVWELYVKVRSMKHPGMAMLTSCRRC